MKSLLLTATAVAAAATFAPALAQDAPAPAEPEHHMTMMAGPMTRDAVAQRVQEHFAMLDANHDGFLTKDEMDKAKDAIHERIEQRMEEHGDAMFDRMDTNHDGSISREEFDAAHSKMAQHMGGPQGMHRELRTKIVMRHGGMMGDMFAMADADKDGRVSLAEAQAAALAHFDKADTDHNGTLSPDEMRAAHKGMEHAMGKDS